MLVNQEVYCASPQYKGKVVILEINGQNDIKCRFEDGQVRRVGRLELTPIFPQEMKIIKWAFRDLMGINGDPFIKEIYITGMLSDKSYEIICDNVSFNGKDSIVKHMGLVYYYHSLTNKS